MRVKIISFRGFGEVNVTEYFGSIGELRSQLKKKHGSVIYETGEDDFIGFHDWLRNGEKIIGVKLFPFELNDFVDHFCKMNLVQDNAIIFFNRKETEYSLKLSDDQDFGTHIYQKYQDGIYVFILSC